MNEIDRRSLLKAGAVVVLTAPFAGYLTGTSSGVPARADHGPGHDPAATGSWTAPINLGGVAIHASLTHAGHIHFFGRRPDGSQRTAAWTWNYTTEVVTSVPIPYSRDLFCVGNNVLPDGRVYLVGGHIFDGGGAIGVPQTDIWDPTARTWTRRATMRQARWYPTTVGMPNGRTLIFGGHARPGNPSNTVEEYTVATNLLTTLPASATRAVGLYPRLHVMPDGRVFKSGPAQQAAIFNRATNRWTTSASMLVGSRNRGMSVPLPLRAPEQAQVLTCGGASGGPPTRTAETIDLLAPTAWRSTGAMNRARLLANAVVLPDGTIFVIGGGLQANYSGPVLTPELYDPATGTWTEMEPHRASRMYHSTALLLPDGRVFCAGQDNGPLATFAEIWSPPYLFRGPRPGFTGAPAAISYNQPFTLDCPDAADVATVTVIRPGSVTHQVNTDQRSVLLPFTRGEGTLTVTAPTNANWAPPGYYLLFVVNSSGVPSVAPWIRIG